MTGLLAYGAFVGYIAELRYGRGPTIDAHAKQQLAQIPPEKTPPYADLARAAEAAVESQLPRAKQIALSIAQNDKQNVDVAILAGEVELLVKEPAKALDYFTQASSLDGGTPRSSFGIARANSALGNHPIAGRLPRRCCSNHRSTWELACSSRARCGRDRTTKPERRPS